MQVSLISRSKISNYYSFKNNKYTMFIFTSIYDRESEKENI